MRGPPLWAPARWSAMRQGLRATPRDNGRQLKAPHPALREIFEHVRRLPFAAWTPAGSMDGHP